MAGLSLDDTAWTNRWRHRSVAEKSVLSLGLLLVAVTARTPVTGLLVVVVATAVACLGARIPVGTWVRVLLAPASFVLLGVVGIAVTLTPSSTAGSSAAEVWWTGGPFAVTAVSAAQAGETAVRAIAGASAVMLLACTTPMPYLLGALSRVPGFATLAEIGGVVYRMLFGLLHAQARVRESQAARLGFRTPSVARRSIGLLAATTLVRAWTGARRLEEGLAGRAPAGVPFGAPATDALRWAFVVPAAVVVLATGVVGWFA
ncbi:cobalt ECF transporter T component CbiQ [Nocardioides fonticola]|uniref:Cobalt ECF transporter T component CbiQ n=1 Tax=Nocardioides fonticola TaxID=450363 RepID=A0ABP7XWF2_9ACTN